jgi:hypothetical protein
VRAALFGSHSFSNRFTNHPYSDFLLGVPTTARAITRPIYSNHGSRLRVLRHRRVQGSAGYAEPRHALRDQARLHGTFRRRPATSARKDRGAGWLGQQAR